MAIRVGNTLLALPPFKLNLSGLSNLTRCFEPHLDIHELAERPSNRPRAAPSIVDETQPNLQTIRRCDASFTTNEVSAEEDPIDKAFDKVKHGFSARVVGDERKKSSIHDIAAVCCNKDTQSGLPMAEQATVSTAEDEVEWTPEMVQAIREKTYVTFEGEDESDYTLGPARMIDAADGVVTCTALLVTMELSQAIQTSIRAQRDFKRARAAADGRLVAISRLQSALSTQILRDKNRLGAMSDVCSEEAISKKQALEAEFSILKLMVEEYKLERSSIRNNMEYQGEQLRRAQAEANTLLEEAWTTAKIMEPESEAQEEDQASAPQQVDLQAEYQAFRQKLKNDGDFSMLEAAEAQLDTSNDHLRKETSPEAKAREEELELLQKATWDAWDRLQEAQAAFDHRDDDRYDEEQDRKAIIRRGEQPEDASSEAFDLRWHAHERALTRELIEAERAYDAANAAAVEAGAINGDTHDEGDDLADYDDSDEVVDDVPATA